MTPVVQPRAVCTLGCSAVTGALQMQSLNSARPAALSLCHVYWVCAASHTSRCRIGWCCGWMPLAAARLPSPAVDASVLLVALAHC